jgi:uncharacterized protein YdhG (YjbR/CyaY superfamily)
MIKETREMKSTTKAAKKSAKKAKVFSDAELEAMQDAKVERKKGAADGEADLMAKVKEMKGLDREIAEKLHAIVKANAPGLTPRTWYGMPAYAGADGKAVIFFTPAAKFKERYATLGFNTGARLDDGDIWATSFAVTGLGDAVEKKIVALVKKAAG